MSRSLLGHCQGLHHAVARTAGHCSSPGLSGCRTLASSSSNGADASGARLGREVADRAAGC
jgi:hypothetical protein